MGKQAFPAADTRWIEIRTRTRILDVTIGDDGIELATDSMTFRAPAVILAVGGTAHERARDRSEPTSNPANRNSVLYNAVRQLGVEEIDPDRFQFHPYCIVARDGKPTGRCVPESVTELGARVVDRDRRPIVAVGSNRKQINDAMRANQGTSFDVEGTPCFALTLDGLSDEELYARYPHLRRTLEPHRDPDGDVFVTPALHYQLGGFRINSDCATTVPGLYLAGEMTGGLHGENRLMGNGITEAVVDGRTAALAALDYLLRRRLRNSSSGQ